MKSGDQMRREYYWKKFEEILPELVEEFGVGAIVEAAHEEKELQDEKIELVVEKTQEYEFDRYYG